MMHYYVLDVETTGLDAKKHEITQLTIIRVSDRKLRNRYIKADHPELASPEALRVTGRTIADLSTGVGKLEAIEAMEEFLNQDGATPEHRCIIGHNVSFDMRFCHALWAQFKKTFPANCWLCTKAYAKQYATRMGISKPKLSLGDSMEMCGIEPKYGKAHNSEVDTKHTYLLYKFIKEEGVEHLPLIKRIPHGFEKTGSDE